MEHALQFNIFSTNYRFNAENYQLMNYGFGGLIDLHFDAVNQYYNNQIGGGRLTTSMIYLSDPESGGFTIFPKLGLYFKPKSGDMLFWNLRTTDGNNDEGMWHLGCPVLYGDKWILNKWIRWEAQMFKYKCFLPKGDNFKSNADVLAQ